MLAVARSVVSRSIPWRTRCSTNLDASPFSHTAREFRISLSSMYTGAPLVS